MPTAISINRQSKTVNSSTTRWGQPVIAFLKPINSLFIPLIIV
nr:MAG TPA: hypothetical protein [Caudoviricetes sp.]